MFDRILDLPDKQRVLIYSGGAVLIVLLYTFWFYLPRSKEIVAKRERIQSLETERAALQALLSDPNKAKAEKAEVEGHFNQVKAQLPEQKEIPELLRQVSNLGRDSGLEVLLFRQKPETIQDLYAEVPVEMAVRGVNGQIQIEASFSATTYRFLNEEERQRVAKEKQEAAKTTRKGKKK